MASPKNRRRYLSFLVIAVLIALPLASLIYKVTVLDYRIANILPQTQYRVRLDMELDGGDHRVRVATFAPVDDARQQISDESQTSPQVFHYSVESNGRNRQAVWVGNRSGARRGRNNRALCGEPVATGLRGPLGRRRGRRARLPTPHRARRRAALPGLQRSARARQRHPQ